MEKKHTPEKYYCYLKTRRTKKYDEAVLLNYNKVTFLTDYFELLKVLQPGDTAIFRDVLELDIEKSKDPKIIALYYIDILKTGAELMFEKSSSCDSLVLHIAVDDFEKKGIIKTSSENAFKAILELQIQTYILTTEALSEMKRTEVVIANKVEGKRLGRPAGPSRETPRAKRIKARIIKDSVDFEGSTPVGELVSSLCISRQTYYNYKKQILEKEGDDNENI